MTYAPSSSVNKEEISKAMAATHQMRRKWIDTERPTCTDICLRYRQFLHFKGEMVMLHQNTKHFP